MFGLQGLQFPFQAKPRWQQGAKRTKGYLRIENKYVAELLIGSQRDFTLFALFVHMANLSETQVMADGVMTPLATGGLVTSPKQLAKHLRWAPQTVRVHLRSLAEKGLIDFHIPAEGHIVYVVHLRDAAVRDAPIQSQKENSDHPRSLLSRSIDPNRSYSTKPRGETLFTPGASETRRQIFIVEATEPADPSVRKKFLDEIFQKLGGRDHETSH